MQGALDIPDGPDGKVKLRAHWPSFRGSGAKPTAWVWPFALEQVLPALGSDGERAGATLGRIGGGIIQHAPGVIGRTRCGVPP